MTVNNIFRYCRCKQKNRISVSSVTTHSGAMHLFYIFFSYPGGPFCGSCLAYRIKIEPFMRAHCYLSAESFENRRTAAFRSEFFHGRPLWTLLYHYIITFVTGSCLRVV